MTTNPLPPAPVEQVDSSHTPAQFFFEVGFGACFAEAYIRNGETPPFKLTDTIVERAWEIAGEAHDDPAEFDRYLALANAAVSAIERLGKANVTQADRICAAYLHECIFGTESEEARIGHVRLLSGERDSEFMIQELARHRQAGIAEGLERAIAACEEQAKVFASEQYATPQPIGSLMEQFAVSQCVRAIRTLSDEGAAS